MISVMGTRTLALAVTIYLIGFFTSPALASMIPSKDSSGSSGIQLQQDMEKIQLALENRMVREKLEANGLDAEEVRAKLSAMTPRQIHLLAQASEDVLAGGDSFLGAVIAVLVIIILVIVILKLLDRDIIIKMSCEGTDTGSFAPVC